LQYNDERWYAPDTARWLSEDPIRFAAGDVNLYRYVGNDATGATDPSGEALMPSPAGIPRYNDVEVAAFKEAVNGLPTGNELRQLIWLQRLNEERAKKNLEELGSLDDIDKNQPSVEAGVNSVIIQMLKDHPDDGPGLFRRMQIGQIGIEGDSSWFKSYGLQAMDRKIVLDETKRVVGLRRARTVGEAAGTL